MNENLFRFIEQILSRPGVYLAGNDMLSARLDAFVMGFAFSHSSHLTGEGRLSSAFIDLMARHSAFLRGHLKYPYYLRLTGGNQEAAFKLWIEDLLKIASEESGCSG